MNEISPHRQWAVSAGFTLGAKVNFPSPPKSAEIGHWHGLARTV
jgi:hypothetical protein